MREDEAQRIEQAHDNEPDVRDTDNEPGTWECTECGVENSQIDGECQFCDGPAVKCTCDEGGSAGCPVHDAAVKAVEPLIVVYSVAVYLVDRQYGGSEEGGWWYNAGNPCESLGWLFETIGELALPKYFAVKGDDNKALVEHVLAVQIRLDETINQGRHEIGSVLSTGWYYAVAEIGHPAAYPKERPHYE